MWIPIAFTKQLHYKPVFIYFNFQSKAPIEGRLFLLKALKNRVTLKSIIVKFIGNKPNGKISKELISHRKDDIVSRFSSESAAGFDHWAPTK